MSTQDSRDTADAATIMAAEIDAEQAYVDGLFDRLDAEVAKANQRLAAVMKDVDPHNPDADALLRRETEYHSLQAKLDKLNLAQLGLVFGRIDIDAAGDNPTTEGLDRRYIGRMGMDDRADDYRTLLLDWRASMARPFYLATTAQPEGVAVRRHIRTTGRSVTGINDEVLSGTSTPASSSGAGVAEESALQEALHRARTGYMTSIVETIQREQDTIIRDPTRGVIVVEGGPGTGKTAVALHRVAYLLYTHRDFLAATGVLIVGPNPTFLDYISRVLPELGETGVVLSTVGDMFPGVHGTSEETLAAREVKGSEAMMEILSNAVKNYQVVPPAAQRVRIDSIELFLRVEVVKKARTRARRSRRPHNEARRIFAEALIDELAQQLARRIGTDPLGGANLLSRADIDQLHDDLAETTAVEDLLDKLWPALTPTQVLSELLESREAIDAAAVDYDDETRDALYRANGAAWTASDAALLDELAVLLGMPDAQEQRDDEERKWREQLADAEDALDILASSDSTDNDDDAFDAEILSAHDVIDAETLARRHEVRERRTTAQRAQADYAWTYGHVIVDEAQELTPMEWRMLFRRSPARWMTIVGDTAQTSAPAGVDDWADTLAPFVRTRFRHHRLTVNYRTPQPITNVANHILQVIDPDTTQAQSIRDGAPVRFLPADKASTVLGSDALVPGIITGSDGRLHATIDKSNVTDIKGLEFDHVTVVDPQGIVNASPQGWQDLYVAITRATQTLTVVGELDDLPLD